MCKLCNNNYDINIAELTILYGTRLFPLIHLTFILTFDNIGINLLTFKLPNFTNDLFKRNFFTH